MPEAPRGRARARAAPRRDTRSSPRTDCRQTRPPFTINQRNQTDRPSLAAAPDPYPDRGSGGDPDPPSRNVRPMPTPNELYDQAVDLKDQGDRAGAIARLET